MGNLQWGVEA